VGYEGHCAPSDTDNDNAIAAAAAARDKVFIHPPE
jgi:hypothetical protein